MGARATLVTADEIRAIIARAEAELTAVEEEEDRLSEEGAWSPQRESDLTERGHAASRALDFCIEAAGWLGDPSFLPFILEMVDRVDEHSDAMDLVAGALGDILATGVRPTPEIAALSRHRNMNVRLALATHLDPADEAAIRILESLATTDPWDHVRKKARERLGPVREIAWWEGKFSQDPLRGLADAEALRGPLEAIATLLALSVWEQDKRAGELADAIGALPDALALDVLGRVLTNRERSGTAPAPALIALHVARAPTGVLGLVQSWGQSSRVAYAAATAVGAAAPLIPREARLVAARHLLEHALDLEERAATLAAQMVAAFWPGDEDPTPVVDTILSREEAAGGHDRSATNLNALLRREDLDVTPIVARVVEARLAGYPAPWKHAPGVWDGVLDRAPASAVRSAAERAIESGDRATIAWGLKQLVGRVHDPAHDPPPPALLARAYAVPAQRAALLADGHLTPRILPLARADLRARRLRYAEAGAVMRTIDRLWGGLAKPNYRKPLAEETAQQALRTEVAAFLGPPDLHGPPTEAEWSIYRDLRDGGLTAGADRPTWVLALDVLPDGPWIPSDRALVPRAQEVAGRLDLAFVLASTLGARPEPEWLPVLDALCAIDPDDDLTLEQRTRTRVALGLQDPASSPEPAREAPRPSPAPPAAAPARDWMDEPDDDD